MNEQITVVGLGSGDPDQLTLGVWRRLQSAARVFVRTADHPMMALLKEQGISFVSFDSVYEQMDSFPDVYEAIAAKLLEEAASSAEPIVYAVPGHPMVAERTVQLLRERCPEGTLAILGGESFLDQAFLRLGIDPIDGFALLDAAGLSPSAIRPQMHTIIGQVYDTFTASDVKLALMERYPDHFEVVVAHALGVAGEEQIIRVPLYELDRVSGFGNLSLIWVPRSDDPSLLNRSFDRLHEIVAILRSPEGCPWDREQTHQSIRKNFIEELYEALEALDQDDPDGMREEFGDVILQVMLHSQMEEEVGAFSVYDVIQTLNEKLIFRHPHVFGDMGAGNAEEALGNWEQMKAEEKRRKGLDPSKQSALDGIPPDLPALMKAYKLQKKASKVGFDWGELEPVLAKVEEELAELRKAIRTQGADEQAGELGDLLFAAVNVSRFIDADPEEALSRTIAKFKSRFAYIEEQLRISGRKFDQTDLTEMDRWWEEAKRLKL
ncbi:nucleoside triphosphate pyrophosphohydrolase [Paenibacillus protaetiae]|uniref:Nucleoside triphosphate pyrophosphohydrolase n=1 Tax=Paenibacillus protaetiae TaxID=2509456 RepID=A0A4V0YFE6_9BACL|nr:nucleoside triphosphate pyrophosphohydrolase [Paenibacillus protaetiae]QAY67441.1 nucleoside triphosphate pyrophosphohydrolase [Paenibacillus protaetiae]